MTLNLSIAHTDLSRHFDLTVPYFVHDGYVRGVGPEAVVHRHKVDPSIETEDGGEHHVGAVQGMDEVWRE